MPIITATTEIKAFTATGNGTELTISGHGAAWVEGTFVGTVVLEKQPPGASGFVPVLADAYGVAVQLTAPGALQIFEPIEGTRYRWRCSAYTSGTITTGLADAG